MAEPNTTESCQSAGQNSWHIGAEYRVPDNAEKFQNSVKVEYRSPPCQNTLLPPPFVTTLLYSIVRKDEDDMEGNRSCADITGVY